MKIRNRLRRDFSLKGLYIHIPFCLSKCGYCDFYSLKFSRSLAEKYTDELINRLQSIHDEFDTVYFGGGTPSVIGSERICRILNNVHHADNAEITVECNPKTAVPKFLGEIAECGVNRISIGLQSANAEELRSLTRTHSAADAANAVYNAKQAGIDDISLDVMLGIQGQTKQSLIKTIDFCASLPITHVSAYMLKIEPNTPFFNADMSVFPSDDDTAELYETAVHALENHGFMQYEISNFAKCGFTSRHNLKYWNCEEYLGLGPAAHSFTDRKRYYFPRDIDYFLNGSKAIFDDDFGGFEEYAMLQLRLNSGLDLTKAEKMGLEIPCGFLDKCRIYEPHGLLRIDGDNVRLTLKGFLVQNELLAEIL